MASPITSLKIVYSTVYSMLRSKKTSKIRVTGLCAGDSSVTGEFPTQRANHAEKVSVWWRHDDNKKYHGSIGEVVAPLSWRSLQVRITWIVWATIQNHYAVSTCMMTSSKGNISRVTGPLCRDFTGPVNSPHEDRWRELKLFSLICAKINRWVNNREAGDLGRHRSHYNGIVMDMMPSL